MPKNDYPVVDTIRPPMRLFFLMVYLKNNPIQQFQAASFGISQGQISHLFKALNGLLSLTLKKMGLVPTQDNEELQIYLKKHKINTLYKDVTERPIARKVDYEAQKEDFSSKKIRPQKRPIQLRMQ